MQFVKPMLFQEAVDKLGKKAPIASSLNSSEWADVPGAIRERAFWFYLTAHRLGDLRRLVNQYGRAKESVYPTGAYHKQGLTRGTQATLIVPHQEENNPNYQASACTVNTP